MRTIQRALVAVTVSAACAALTFPVAATAAASTRAANSHRAANSPRALALAALRGLRAGPVSGGELRSLPEVRAGKTTAATSLNWSGYVAFPSAGDKMDNVVGSWTEPGVTCTTDENQEAVFWVGLDGWTNDTVEQAGTVAECYEGAASYYTWWEMYPTNAITVVGSTVAPGDQITASVVYDASNKQYTLAVTDATIAANSFSVAEKCEKGIKCANSSADWIGETPSNIRGYYPLPDFGTWTVTAGEAAQGKAAKSISGFSNDDITLLGDAGYALATPSALNGAGTGFTDTWDNSY